MTNSQFDEVERLLARRGDGRVCPTCGAAPIEVAPGIEEWAPSSHLLYDQEVPCDCARQTLLLRHYLLAHVPDAFMRLGPDDYVGDPKAWAEVERYLDHWTDLRRHGIGLGVYSQSQGTGKTMLATWVARRLVQRGERVYCVNFRSLIKIYDLPGEARVHEEDRVRGDRVLVLDEVGTPISEAQRAFFEGQFEELIRHRTDYGLVTILTTNLPPKELDRLYPRVYSLLASRQRTIYVAGGDVRREGMLDVNEALALNGEIRPIC